MISLRVILDCLSSFLRARLSAMALFVKRPCLRALRLPFGAPLPSAPPCMRQRFLPETDGERHDVPLRVLAPHRAARRIDKVSRG